VPVYNNDINIEINSAPSQTMIVNQVYPCIEGPRGERGPTGPIGPSGPSGTTNLTYGSFFDTTTQTNATPNIARGVKYNSTAESDGISINADL